MALSGRSPRALINTRSRPTRRCIVGGGLIKQRIARAGQGKRGGYRMIIAYRRGDRAVFLYGFAKNERGNIDADEQAELRRLARGYLGLDEDEIEAAIAEDELSEVGDVEEG